jgi:hypothetical protein
MAANDKLITYRIAVDWMTGQTSPLLTRTWLCEMVVKFLITPGSHHVGNSSMSLPLFQEFEKVTLMQVKPSYYPQETAHRSHWTRRLDLPAEGGQWRTFAGTNLAR